MCTQTRIHANQRGPQADALPLGMQAVMGSLIKQYLGRKMGRPPEAIYHVAIMPCYDKKLEASREDFLTPGACLSSTPTL